MAGGVSDPSVFPISDVSCSCELISVASSSFRSGESTSWKPASQRFHRLNDVLAAWTHGRLEALIEGPDAPDVSTQIEAFGRPHLAETELAMRGLVRRQDGTLYDADKGEIVGE